ncbi:MAG: ROK family protein [Acidimicrobiales bacterium]
MTKPPQSTRDAILAVDIGATTIKFGFVGVDGDLVDDVVRLPTPYPCSPARLVEYVTERISASGCTQVGVGFPGALVDGLVIEPGNLSRPEGFTSSIDQSLHDEWLQTDLQRAFRDASKQDVRVVNDATLAALGCSEGHGRELVITLGTGFGIALVVDGSLVRIRDVGDETFADDQTYDQVLGDYARSQDEELWQTFLVRAVVAFAREFSADVVHLGGGNARRVDLASFANFDFRVSLSDNNATLRGVVKLFAR